MFLGSTLPPRTFSNPSLFALGHAIDTIAELCTGLSARRVQSSLRPVWSIPTRTRHVYTHRFTRVHWSTSIHAHPSKTNLTSHPTRDPHFTGDVTPAYFRSLVPLTPLQSSTPDSTPDECSPSCDRCDRSTSLSPTTVCNRRACSYTCEA